MSWIREVLPNEADGLLAELFSELRRTRGKISNIMTVQSLAPEAMQHHLSLYMSIMFGKGGLSRGEREMLAVVVSVTNGCEYCTLHHVAALKAWWKDDRRVLHLERGEWSEAGLSPREQALVDYAILLTEAPALVAEAEVRRLRSEGLTDDEVLQANLVISYFNFVNRIAEGLGVEAPPEEVEGYQY